MKRVHPIVLSLIPGILLWLSWPVSPLTPLIFIGFVLLFFIADLEVQRSRFFAHSLVAMLVWNAGSTWWIWNSTGIGAVAAIIANSLIMCLPWWGYHLFRHKFGRRTGYAAFITFWMAFEYIHLNWQLSWPWLNLGNVFATQPDWVQWYEYTGIGGGTLWVLLANVLIHDWLFGNEVKHQKGQTFAKIKSRKSLGIVLLLIIPILISYLMIPGIKNHSTPGTSVIIVQPNIDPYGKFEEATVSQQIQTHLQLSSLQLDSTTTLVIWPETALSASIEINDVTNHPLYHPVFEFVNNHPNITLLTGIETYRWYGTEKPASKYARKTKEGAYYDSYNAAVSIKAGQPLQYYVKSKLVPGVETLPSFLNFMGPVFEKFGGTTGGYAMDSAAVAFKNAGNPYITAPIICYESIYGDYITAYINRGANLLTIITNDGWWGNTPGHKQHLHYARLRAIETRKWIARSANTGISAVLDNYGNILDTRSWDTAASIKFNIPALEGKTFYVKNGEYLYKFFTLLAGLLVLWNLVAVFQKRFRRA